MKTWLSLLFVSCCALAWAPFNWRHSVEDDLPIIDAHVHTSYDNPADKNESTGITYSREGLLAEFKRANVVGAISMMSRTGTGYDEAMVGHNVAFCVGVPIEPNYAEIEAGLQSKKYSCIKIYLGYIHKPANDEIYQPIYALAEKYSVPVVFHTGDTYDVDGKLKYSDVRQLDELAVDHRKVTMVIAHLGNPDTKYAAEVAYKNPNVYLEGSAIVIGNLNRYADEVAEEQMIRPIREAFNYLESPEKLMFGTDWPLTPIDQYVKLFKKAIPKEHWKKVFHDNAVRVYKLKLPLLETDDDSSSGSNFAPQQQQGRR